MRTYISYPNTTSVYTVQTSNGQVITPPGVYHYVPNQPVQNLTMGSFICPQQTMVIPQVVSPGMFYAPMQPVGRKQFIQGRSHGTTSLKKRLTSFCCLKPRSVSPIEQTYYQIPYPAQHLGFPSVGGTPVYQTTQLPPAPVQQAPAYTESDVQQMKDMFPGIETNVIQSVFIAQRGNKNAVINSLLSMSSEQ